MRLIHSPVKLRIFSISGSTGKMSAEASFAQANAVFWRFRYGE